MLIIRVAIDFGPTMQLRGKKEEKHPRKKREFLDGEWNPKIPQPVCVYTCTHTTALRLQKMHIAVIKSNAVSIIDGSIEFKFQNLSFHTFKYLEFT